MTARAAWMVMTLVLAGLTGAPTAAAQGAATHSSNVWDVTFARDEKSVATVARGEVRIWALPSGQLACRLDGPYYSARVATDGESGYHVTLLDNDRNVHRARRAFRIDPGTCREVPAAVVAGALGSYAPVQYVVRAPDGRILPNGFATSPDSRLVIRPEASAFVIETPGGARLESEKMPTALEIGPTVYACTWTSRKITYHRIAGDRRAEKVGESDPDRYGMSACGPLLLSADSTVLLNVGNGAAVDLQRKRVIASYPLSRPTGAGIDAARERMTIGHATGAVVLDARSGKPAFSMGGNSKYGYVSLRTEWIAIASNLVSRPLVELQGRTLPNIVLDDARSRPAADILGAAREAEIRAREAADRAEAARAAAARAQARADAEAKERRMRSLVEQMVGSVDVAVTLRQVQYQGGYEFVPVTVRVGDVLVLVSEYDGVIGYAISDGVVELRGERTRTQKSDGFSVARSTLTGNVSGNLRVYGSGAPVYVFVVRKADVK